jgi:hypothetical protein
MPKIQRSKKVKSKLANSKFLYLEVGGAFRIVGKDGIFIRIEDKVSREGVKCNTVDILTGRMSYVLPDLVVVPTICTIDSTDKTVGE